jgi:hypothetical protein
MAVSTADLFSEGLGFSESRRPVISNPPTSISQPGQLVLDGTGFRGDSEASGSASNNSATNYPILQLMRIDNEQSFFVLSDLATNWSDTVFSSQTLNALPSGQYRVTIFTNAIPSLSKIISIGGPPLQLVSAVSRKTHGSAGNFDVDLTNGGIECRSGGANGNYTLVFTFANPLTSVAGASVSSGTGAVSSSAIGSDAHEYIVDLTGVTSAQTVTVSLTNVSDTTGANSPTISASMDVLVGDINGNKATNNTDVAAVKAQVAAPVDSSNFRSDINANGVISNTDVSAVKAQVGATLP